MKKLLFSIRNLLQRLVGPVALHRLRKRIVRRSNTENGSCGHAERWIYIYPTFACTLKCSYCQNLHATGIHNPLEQCTMTPRAWAESINRIGRHVVISGGDPFVYHDLPGIVNRIAPHLKVVICSDLSAPGTLDALRAMRRPVSLDATYHPSSGKSGKFLQTVEAARGLDGIEIALHSVAAGKAVKFLRRTQKEFLAKDLRLNLVAAYGDLAFEGSRQQQRETVYCTKRNINIGPDGKRYPCLTKTIRMQDPLCSVTAPGIADDMPPHLCNDFGHCVPGDLEEVGMRIERLDGRGVLRPC
ncbi:radical SAM protein [Ramlibacter sp.]|uniref:radical SAM protein n=1 Tax=Ramlibacter sp. TaxID=1917967 RepID=UPI003D12C08C